MVQGLILRAKQSSASALLLASACTLTAFPAQAQTAIEASGTGTTVGSTYDKSYAPGGGLGLIIISRDFGPRNAIIPEVGRAHTVDVSPDAMDNAFADVFGALSDDQVAQINSGTGTTPQMGTSILAPTELLAGNDNIMREASVGAGGAGGLGSTISDAIGQGMGALTSCARLARGHGAMIRASRLALLSAAALSLLPGTLAAQTARDPAPLNLLDMFSQPGSPAAGSTGSPAQSARTVVTGTDTVTINAGGSVNGAATINGAAGLNNIQANMGLIASGENALTAANINQMTRSDGTAGGGNAHVTLAADSLAGSSGWIAVSGVAGADNQQLNLAVMAMGIEGLVVSDITLAQSSASTKPMGENGAADASPSRSVAVGPGALKDGSGVVQLTLVGGDRNHSANTFALLVVSTAPPE